MILERVALLRFGLQPLAGGGGIALDGGDGFVKPGKLGGFNLLALVERPRFHLTSGHALFDGADLLGLQRQAAARALGFEIQLGHAGARLGERSVHLIAGFLGARVFLFLALHLSRKVLEIGLREIQVQRELGGFALQYLKPARDRTPQMAQHFGAQLLIALGLGGLALERVRLASDLFENVKHARQVLFGAFELRFRQALARFVLADAGGFLDHGAAVGWLVGENLADAALLDDGVALGTESGAHEEFLNVAQARGFAVDQIFAFARAVKAARDGDLGRLVRGVTVAIGVAIRVTVLREIWNSMRAAGSAMVSVTCAIPRGLRSRVPAKMTSSMREPRRLLALCSPSTQLMASLKLDFPQPFGPTTAVTPEPWKRISVRS